MVVYVRNVGVQSFSLLTYSIKSSEAPFAVKILATKPTSVSELKLSCRAGYSGMSAVISLT